MTTYKNCDKPENPNGPIMCNKCKREYIIEFDSLKAPYKIEGILKCACGVELVKWNSIREHSLKSVKKDE